LSKLSKSSSVRKTEHSQYKLKKCPKCNYVWELHYQTNTISRYSDFPAYGLKKEICSKCKAKE